MNVNTMLKGNELTLNWYSVGAFAWLPKYANDSLENWSGLPKFEGLNGVDASL